MSRFLKHPVWGTGFRSFFLLAALAAVVLVPYWLLVFIGGQELSTAFDPVSWHRHEMIFGYTSAVLAGFFLTAVPNWTKTSPRSGGSLLGLTCLWLLGRIAMGLSAQLPGGLVAGVDLLFLPAVALAILPPLWRSWNTRNLGWVPLLLAMSLGNLSIHLDHLEIWEGHSSQGLQMALNLVVLVMLVVGGRVIPYFTRRALDVEIFEWSWLSPATTLASLALVVVDLLLGPGVVLAGVCLLTAILGSLRLSRWQFRESWRRPILWVLSVGFGGILLGLVVKAVAVFHPNIPNRGATHFLTVGGIGILTLGMMSRVALGHTGRPLQVSRLMAFAFLLISLAALIRGLGPLVYPDHYFLSLEISGGLWTVAFLCYLWTYIPILLAPRPDGKSG
jgi:uncharacterized protein involved in response to NO